MDVAVVHEPGLRIDDLVASLDEAYSVRTEALDSFLEKGAPGAAVTLVCSGLGSREQFLRVRTALEACGGDSLVVLPTHNSDSIARLRELDVHDYFVQPVEGRALRAATREILSRRSEALWSTLEPVQAEALKSSLACFEKCFSNVRKGIPLPMDEISRSCQQIRAAAELGEFDRWIEVLSIHHNNSFKHTMYVSGALTYFSHAIGIGGTDLESLAVGGLLHDVGKAMVPLSILEKPDRLDEEEWSEMRRHPAYSREILLRDHGVDEHAVAMAVHHHERLDGGGYPDGLSAAEIGDATRLTTIADVYSALIERRAYKPPMDNESALDLMQTFEGHLDMDLLKVFRDFVLDGR